MTSGGSEHRASFHCSLSLEYPAVTPVEGRYDERSATFFGGFQFSMLGPLRFLQCSGGSAKGVALAGVEAIVAEGFERIHRTNLIGMGVMPLQFESGTSRKTLEIDGTEIFDVQGQPEPGARLTLILRRRDGSVEQVPVICRLDTAEEVSVYSAGGILQRFAKEFVQETVAS